MKLFKAPFREYVIIGLVLGFLVVHTIVSSALFDYAFVSILILASVITFWDAIVMALKLRIGIDTFNAFALGASFLLGSSNSTAFIVLMLSCARLLDWYTESRASRAMEELLKLKPLHAVIERNGSVEEVPVVSLAIGDVVIVKVGGRVPVDGVVVEGEALLNEASISGESRLIPKKVGGQVMSGTLNESGVIKVRAERVGADSTIERVASLITQASEHKSHAEKLGDRFAKIFLPIVLALGVITFLITKSSVMVVALFLIACADDVAVSIPLAMTAAIGLAAKRGVIIKGGEWLEALGTIDTLVVDKTGTLTYGEPKVVNTVIESDVAEDRFWSLIGIAEKFSEHPIAKAVVEEAVKKVGTLPDSLKVKEYKGSGLLAHFENDEIAVGDESLFTELGITIDDRVKVLLNEERDRLEATSILVYLNGSFVGMVSVADKPKVEARESIKALNTLGIKVVMFTGDDEHTARAVANSIGISEVRASMKPEDKLRELEVLTASGKVAMVGDGVNDAPALARAHVGIAMGTVGSAVAVEAADIVILTDNLSRIPEMIELARRTSGVVRGDMAIWVVTNLLGFALVFARLVNPALAAFYNFITDFFPLINSARLFRSTSSKAKS